MMKEIAACVADLYREEEEQAVKARHDRKRANIKLLLRKYREIVQYVDDAVYEATQLESDVELQEILELMRNNQRETFRVEAIKENVATARMIVDHMRAMLQSYREACERYGTGEDLRRYRVIMALYIDEDRRTIEEVEELEFITRSTVYRDIDAAADRLAVLFFGIYGLKFF
jgi:hypothetical protein